MLNKVIVFLLVFHVSPLLSQNTSDGFQQGMIYVKFREGTLKDLDRENPKDIPFHKLLPFKDLLSKYKVNKVNKPFYQANDDKFLGSVYKFHFSVTSQADRFVEDLSRMKEVEYAEKIPLSVAHATPNDFAILSSSVHLNQINAPQAWNVFNGNSNITVAIVDDAIMWSHADLVANTFTNTAETAGNNVDDDGNGYIDDVNGWNTGDDDNNAQPTNTGMMHGTHCAGIAGARTDNNTGVASIGWNIKIIPVQCQPDGGTPGIVTFGYEGIIYAARTKAKVISCSWGNSISPSITEQAVIDYAWHKGCIIIAAAGNSGNNSTHWPAAYNHVYAVAAVQSNDVKWSGSTYGSFVDICAPGHLIMSTVPYTSSPAYGLNSGSSMAAPMVAGLAALMLSRSPNMTQTDVLNCISATATDIYALNSGYTGQLGAGRINAGAAMTCAATYSVMPPIANFFAHDLFTCPNTPVKFSDSSVYVPTAWSWTFQGASPATSTLQNPVVQYSATGTYSVALTVTNGAGTSTKTKISYITVSGPIALPLQEGFQGAQFLPPSWTAKNIGNDIVYWERVTGVGGFGTSSACAVFDNYNYRAAMERDEMRTPKYDFSNVVKAHLRFDVAYARLDSYYSDSLEVKMSANCGATWTSIYLKGGTGLATASDQFSFFTPTSTQWRKDTVVLSNAVSGQNNVMFSFINHGQYGQPVYLDNINLFFPTPTVTATYPASVCAGEPVTYTSTTTGSNSYTWNVAGNISNGTVATRTYSVPGTYVGTLTAANGTSAASKTLAITVIAIPTLAVSHATICSGNAATVNATGAGSFSWSTGSTSSSAQVSPAVTTIYTVTGVNGGICSSSATATVSVIATPTLVVMNQTVCPGGTATLSASGAGSYLWNTGASTPSLIITPSASAIYTVTGTTSNCSRSATVSLTLGAPLPISVVVTQTSTCPGRTATLTAGGAVSYSWSNGAGGPSTTVSPAGNTVYNVTGAANSCTGSAAVTVSVDPPPASVGYTYANAKLCVGNTITVTASGGTTYSWSTGSTSQTTAILLQNPNNVYSLTAFNGGCEKTITLTIQGVSSTTIALSANATPGRICPGGTATLTAAGADNFVWTGGPSTSSYVVSPSASTTFTVNGASGTCTGSAAITITVNPALSASVTMQDNSCFSCQDGSVAAVTSGGTPPFSYSWVPAVSSTSVATGLAFGCYTVIITDAMGCSGSYVACLAGTTGLGDVETNEIIRVYPNPATEMITAEGSGDFRIKVVNQLGQVLYMVPSQAHQVNINVLIFPRGMYYLEIENNKGRQVKKIILE